MNIGIAMSRRFRIISLGLGLLLVVAVSGLLLLTAQTGDQLPRYNEAKVSRGPLSAEVSATGTLSPVITVQVGSQVSGSIQHLYADFNSRVSKGEVIAQIDPAVFRARLAEAEANVRNARAALQKAEVNVEQTRNNLKRVNDLFKKQLASDSELDPVRFAYKAAQAERQLRKAALAQAEAAQQQQQVNLAYTTIYAPIDGVVISRDVDVGQTVAASLQAPTLFTIAQDLAQMQIETDVDEAFIGMIKEQQPVRFSVFAYPNRLFHGQVTQVRLQPTVEAGVVKYNCIISVDNEDLALKPGMTATVSIEVAHREDVLKVPNSALRYVPNWPAERLKTVRAELQQNEAFVWQLDRQQLKPVKVRPGISGERETEIIGEQVTEGMTIVVPGTRDESSRKRRFGLSLF